ncbi:hypothetical protein BASA61_003237 [Batrachochytrium salamandrivorans]|nr:hypothetical protein BASA60_000589 [Batrachochytrium salamandrivorans]KAH6597137.1 hypothetical protein BASA61_003237 [Batrachochytrium salamandrivorans]
MKFNVLVVAAMVITSVSAGKRKGLPGWLRNGGMTGSGSSYDTFDNEPEPPSQQGSSKNPSSMSQDIKPTNKKEICDAIKAKLLDLHDNLDSRNELLRVQMSGLYMIMGGNLGMRFWEGNDGVSVDENETSESRHREYKNGSDCTHQISLKLKR